MENKKTSQEIDEERVVQTHSNLGLVDARPGESTFPTGTKNHSTELDHAFADEPEALSEIITPEDRLDIIETEELEKEEPNSEK